MGQGCLREIILEETEKFYILKVRCAILSMSLSKERVKIRDETKNPEIPKFWVVDKDDNPIAFVIGTV